ncbi:MAG TPA: DUF1206 domain-containing protein [Acidothermaceae bacterium]|jgi:hypothetical protein
MSSAARVGATRGKHAGSGENAGRRTLSTLARVGLFARGAFYCVLVYLVAQLAGGGGKQANANGALSTIAATPGGLVAIAATAAGFLAFGATRIWGAIRDRQHPRGSRAMTGAQGAFYVALTWVPLSYALGKHGSGSEQQRHQTASGLLRLPAGRELLFALGLIVVGVCVHQFWEGVDQKYADGMDADRSPRWVRAMIRTSGTVGIPARAVVFLPTGVFFMISAVQANPNHAAGLDKELAALAGHDWGVAVLALVSLGLAVFALYSFLEARYRAVLRAD